MKIDILTSGYVSMDHIIKVSSPVKAGFTSLITNQSNVRIYYGGCSVNIAYGLCRLGLNAAPILRVGRDFAETGFRKFLEEGHVPMTGIRELADEVTSVCYLIQDSNHDHTTIFYPGAMDGKYAAKPDPELFKQADLGVITVAAQEDNRFFFAACQKYNVPVVFGMKDDFDAFPPEFLKEILAGSSIIFTNETECRIIMELLGLSDIRQFFDLGKVEILVTTLGKDGSICYTRTASGLDEKRIEPYPVTDIADATGAGDGYITGFLYGFRKGCSPEMCCRLGGAYSSFVLKREGCCTNMPTEAQLVGCFEEI